MKLHFPLQLMLRIELVDVGRAPVDRPRNRIYRKLFAFEAGCNDATIRLRVDRHLFAQQLINRAEVVPLDVAEGVDGVDVVLVSIILVDL